MNKNILAPGARLVTFSLALALTSLCAGCATDPPIRDRAVIEDDNTPLRVAGLIVRPAESRHRDSNVFKGGVEFGYERQRADGSQYVHPNHYVTFDDSNGTYPIPPGNEIFGPRTIEHSALIEHGHVAYNALFTFGRYFQLEPTLGIAYDELKMSSTSRPTVAAPFARTFPTREQRWGITASLAPRLTINDYLAIEARIRAGVEHDGTTTVFGTAFVLRPIPNIDISVGYASRNQVMKMPDNISDIEMSFQGPLVALRLQF